MDCQANEGENQIHHKKRDVYAISYNFTVVLCAYFNTGRRIGEQRFSQQDRNQWHTEQSEEEQDSSVEGKNQ